MIYLYLNQSRGGEQDDAFLVGVRVGRRDEGQHAGGDVVVELAKADTDTRMNDFRHSSTHTHTHSLTHSLTSTPILTPTSTLTHPPPYSLTSTPTHPPPLTPTPTHSPPHSTSPPPHTHSPRGVEFAQAKVLDKVTATVLDVGRTQHPRVSVDLHAHPGEASSPAYIRSDTVYQRITH